MSYYLHSLTNASWEHLGGRLLWRSSDLCEHRTNLAKPQTRGCRKKEKKKGGGGGGGLYMEPSQLGGGEAADASSPWLSSGHAHSQSEPPSNTRLSYDYIDGYHDPTALHQLVWVVETLQKMHDFGLPSLSHSSPTSAR